MPNIEVIVARIASALNKIIHNSHFKKRISLEEQMAQKEELFFRGRQIAYLIYEYFRVKGANGSVENCADLFTISLRNDDIQEVDSKWDGIFIVNDKDSTWWHLGRIAQIKHTRVWKTQDRIGIVWPGDSSEENRTWLSQIEDDGIKKYQARFTKSEFWRQKWKFWEERRGQESGSKTAFTKNYWRLLVSGNQRAMCERRQLQFPPWYK